MAGHIFSLRTAANREDQVVDYVVSKLQKGSAPGVFSLIRPHGLRGYIFIEVASKEDADQFLQGVPYARGILPTEIPYN